MTHPAHAEIPLSRPDISETDIQAVVDVLRTPFLSLGPKLPEFESAFADYVGARFATATSSGTAALHLAVKALGIGRGDEVITTPFSFVASANCVLFEDAVPVFVDIEDTTFNLDVSLIERQITPRTKAILPVHVFGRPANIDAILDIARRHDLRVIEDACEAIGARWRDQRVGSLGDVGVFAFYPNKQMTTGEGGMLVTNDRPSTSCSRASATRVVARRAHGCNTSGSASTIGSQTSIARSGWRSWAGSRRFSVDDVTLPRSIAGNSQTSQTSSYRSTICPTVKSAGSSMSSG